RCPVAGLATAGPRTGDRHRTFRPVVADAAPAATAARTGALVQRNRRDAVCSRHACECVCSGRPGGMMAGSAQMLSWFGIVRLGLVQTALGAVVVLTTSTLNRVMVVELALPAMLPGLLVGIHYALQVLRPRLGYGSDLGGRRVPWIVGGMAVLSGGGVLA